VSFFLGNGLLLAGPDAKNLSARLSRSLLDMKPIAGLLSMMVRLLSDLLLLSNFGLSIELLGTEFKYVFASLCSFLLDVEPNP
jgi:hypothetical protein